MKKVLLFILVLFVLNQLKAQEKRLQFGACIEFKDEFFFKPQANIKYLEFHSLSINGLMRISGNRLGLESSLGFEKSTNYFVRFNDKSFDFDYLNLNRLSFAAMPFVYLMKKEKATLDVGLGLKYYVNLNGELFKPIASKIDLNKVSLKTALNYSKSNFQMGLFVVYDLQSDFNALPTPFSFGFRFGYLGF